LLRAKSNLNPIAEPAWSGPARLEVLKMADRSKTVAEFADAEGVTRQAVYLMWKQGVGPRFYYALSRRRISEEAHQEWRRQREAAAAGEAA
jgi:hypothetical protein